MFSANRWEKYVHISAIGHNDLEHISISDKGKNPKLCIPNYNVQFLFKVRGADSTVVILKAAVCAAELNHITQRGVQPALTDTNDVDKIT